MFFLSLRFKKKKKKEIVMKDPKGIWIQKCKLSSSVKDHVPVHAWYDGFYLGRTWLQILSEWQPQSLPGFNDTTQQKGIPLALESSQNTENSCKAMSSLPAKHAKCYLSLHFYSHSWPSNFFSLCVQLLLPFDIFSLFHLLYFLLMPAPFWRSPLSTMDGCSHQVSRAQ